MARVLTVERRTAVSRGRPLGLTLSLRPYAFPNAESRALDRLRGFDYCLPGSHLAELEQVPIGRAYNVYVRGAHASTQVSGYPTTNLHYLLCQILR